MGVFDSAGRGRYGRSALALSAGVFTAAAMWVSEAKAAIIPLSFQTELAAGNPAPISSGLSVGDVGVGSLLIDTDATQVLNLPNLVIYRGDPILGGDPIVGGELNFPNVEVDYLPGSAITLSDFGGNIFINIVSRETFPDLDLISDLQGGHEFDLLAPGFIVPSGGAYTPQTSLSDIFDGINLGAIAPNLFSINLVDASGGLSGDVSNINFIVTTNSGGEPVPEPGTLFGFALLVGAGGWHLIRRRDEEGPAAADAEPLGGTTLTL